jgi:steroid delta-isomerase-like uncharacterized protein
MSEENKELVRRYMQEVDKADPQVMSRYFAPDYVEHNPIPGAPTPDLKGQTFAFELALKAFPSYRHTVDDLIADGDKVVARITGYGRHEGEFLGIPATHKDIEVKGIAIWRIADGKIIEHWNEVDKLGLMQQLGVVPPMG